MEDGKWSPFLVLTFHPKMRILSRRLQDDLFHVLYNRETRAGGQFMFERFNAVGWTFRQNFNAAIRHVLDIAHNLMASSCTLSEESIAYSLHFATYQKLSRNFACHLLLTQPLPFRSDGC